MKQLPDLSQSPAQYSFIPNSLAYWGDGVRDGGRDGGRIEGAMKGPMESAVDGAMARIHPPA